MQAMARLVIFALLVEPAGSTPPADALTKAWQARAARATAKLAKGGLDPCDRAVEVAFQNPKVDASTDRSYLLAIRIGEEHVLVGYHYKSGVLDDFSMFGVPPRWMVHQPAGSKTVSVVLGDGPKCAFDLCSNDPFSDGPCSGG